MKAFNPSKSLYSSNGEQTLALCLGLVPLFLVTIRSWSSAVLIFGAVACVIFMLRPASRSDQRTSASWYDQPLIVFVLLAPVLSVAASSLIRGSHVLANYDSPMRFLVAVAIFLFALTRRINTAACLQYTAPASLILTLLHQFFFVQPRLWGPDRMSTYFADPLVFGYTALTLGLISLVSINLLEKDSKPVVILKLAGLAAGVYLSIMSGSRTGWMAVPVVMVLWAYRQKYMTRKVWKFATLGLTSLLMCSVYALSATVQQRLLLGFNEAFDYPWVGIAPNTSVGSRITFLRIAFDMFLSSPLAGHGDNGYDLTALPAHVYTYASAETLKLAFNSGFHNEMVSNAVRFGVGGFLAAAMLLLVPMALFIRQSASNNVVHRANAMLGLVLTVCFLISSLSTEVFDLKYMASFYAVMVALLCASAIAGSVTHNISATPSSGS